MVGFAHLQAPLTLGALTVRNRVVWRAHHGLLADPGVDFGDPGKFGERIAAYIAPRAEAGVGMVVLGPALIHHSSVGYLTNAPALWDRASISGLTRSARVLESAGSVGVVQLFQAELPSGIGSAPSELVEDLILGWARSARNATSAGLAGVELYAGSGSLLGAVLAESSDFGRDFLDELVGRIREFMSGEAALGIALDRGPYAAAHGADMAARWVPSYLSLVDGAGLASMYDAADSGFEDSSRLRAAVARAMPAGQPAPAVIGGSRVADAAAADEAIRLGQVDAVGVVRSLIADPKWLEKAADGRSTEIRGCTACSQNCGANPEHGLPLGCATNPVAGRERSLGAMYATRQPGRIVVVGGGPAGLEAAWVAAARRHSVTLLEAAPELGGAVRLGALLPGRQALAGFIDWRVEECVRRGVDLRVNTTADVATLVELEPDLVILAVGGGLPVADPNRAKSWDLAAAVGKALRDGPRSLGDRILVADQAGSAAGAAFAELCGAAGVETVLAVPEADLYGCDRRTRRALRERLGLAGVAWRPHAALVSVDRSAGGLVLTTPVGSLERLGAGWTVVECGRASPSGGLWGKLRGAEWRGTAPQMVGVGDALAIRDVGAAVAEGHAAGRLL